MPKEMVRWLSSWGSVLAALLVLLGGSYWWGGEMMALNARMGAGEEKDTAQDRLLQAVLARNLSEKTRQDRVEGMVEGIYKRGLVVTGQAHISGVGEPRISLNLLHNVVRLQEFARVRATNLSHPERPSMELLVGPSFANTTDGFVCKISAEGGSLLGATEGSWTQIRIEPIYED